MLLIRLHDEITSLPHINGDGGEYLAYGMILPQPGSFLLIRVYLLATAVRWRRADARDRRQVTLAMRLFPDTYFPRPDVFCERARQGRL